MLFFDTKLCFILAKNVVLQDTDSWLQNSKCESNLNFHCQHLLLNPVMQY